MRYFLITGLDNGQPIEPYIVETYADHPHPAHFNVRGDAARYYEKLTYEEAQQLIKNGIEVY